MGSSARTNDSLPVWLYVAAILLLAGAAALLFPLFHHGKTASSAQAPAPGAAQTRALPDPRLTPGDVLTTDTRTVCVPGYTQTVRNVPEAVKRQVYAQYGIASHQPGEFEVDHLVSLELGGSNSLSNLWPESYISQPLNAHLKDELENRLHDLVCDGKLSIQTAQREIARNWVAAYRKYVGPLPSR